MTDDKTDGRTKALATGALASGAFALGFGGTATAQQASSALLFTYDYSPRRQFQTVAQIQQSTTNSILADLVGQADEWTGFICLYKRGENDPGEFFLAFTRGGPLGSGEFSTNVSFFQSDANLLRVEISEVRETTTPAEETTTPAEETTTPAEETTTPAEETTTPAEETTTTPANETTTQDVQVGTTATQTDGG